MLATRIYGLLWIVGGVAAIIWAAPAIGRYYDRAERASLVDRARPVMAYLMRNVVRFVGAATIVGGVLIVVFPDQL